MPARAGRLAGQSRPACLPEPAGLPSQSRPDCLQCICIYPPPCLQAREACPGHPSCFSDLLRSGAVSSSVLRTQQLQAVMHCVTRFGQFCTFFSKHSFNNDLYQKGSHGTPQNTRKSQKTAKNLASERTRGRAMQKSSVWKGLSSKSMSGAMF